LFKILSLDNASKLERALKALKSLIKKDKIQRALKKIYKNNDILILHQMTRHVNIDDRILKILSKLSVTSLTSSCSSSIISFERDLDFVDREIIVD